MRLNLISRFVVANTTETLLLGDLETLKLSEIPWQTRGGGGSGGGDGNGSAGGGGGGSDAIAEKFIFDSPSAALIYHASELSIVEYGRNEVRRRQREQHLPEGAMGRVLLRTDRGTYQVITSLPGNFV